MEARTDFPRVRDPLRLERSASLEWVVHPCRAQRHQLLHLPYFKHFLIPASATGRSCSDTRWASMSRAHRPAPARIWGCSTVHLCRLLLLPFLPRYQISVALGRGPILVQVILIQVRLKERVEMSLNRGQGSVVGCGNPAVKTWVHWENPASASYLARRKAVLGVCSPSYEIEPARGPSARPTRWAWSNPSGPVSCLLLPMCSNTRWQVVLNDGEAELMYMHATAEYESTEPGDRSGRLCLHWKLFALF